ncbi:MAG: VanZ family protein [Clostridia bacterium]|nr:VanZ family protein [Clostridia bacterium]
MRKSRKTAALWAAAALWTALLFYLAAQNGAESGALSEKILKIVLRILPGLANVQDILHTALRKLAHFGGFMIEGFLIAMTMRRTWPRTWFRIGAPVCALLAVLNEITQLFSGGRSCEIRDMLIDFCGALLGMGVARWIARRKVG